MDEYMRVRNLSEEGVRKNIGAYASNADDDGNPLVPEL